MKFCVFCLQIIFVEGNFWGRSIAAVSSSTDPESYINYGLFTPGLDITEYNDINAMKKCIEKSD